MGEILHRAFGQCPNCGRTVAGKACGPEKRAADRRWVRLQPHVRNPAARRTSWCLLPGEVLRVPRVPAPAPGLG